MKYIGEVEDVFDISSLGCVVVPGIPYTFEPSISVGGKLQFNNPSGSVFSAELQGFEMINRGKPMSHTPFSIDRSVKKGDIEIGAKIYLLKNE